MGRCGAQIVNNINLSLASIEKKGRGQVTRSFVEIVPTLNEEKLRPREIATTVEQSVAQDLFVQVIISVGADIIN